MTYEIKQKYITGTNRPGKLLQPQGIVIHSTATPGAPAINIRDYFQNHPEAKASAHTAIDWTTIIEIIPDNENAWHAGPTANRLFIGIELCEPKEYDPAKFADVWNRAVWYAAQKCKKFGWTVAYIRSHDQISKQYKETDHTDPIGYFSRYGKTWADFLLAVDKELKGADEDLLTEAKIHVNGKELTGFIKDGSSYAPVRALAEALGAKVVWNETKKIVEITK